MSVCISSTCTTIRLTPRGIDDAVPTIDLGTTVDLGTTIELGITIVRTDRHRPVTCVGRGRSGTPRP